MVGGKYKLEWLEGTKAFIELGVLGMSALLVIMLTWFYFKKFNDINDRDNKRIDKKDDKNDDRLDLVIQMLNKQNTDYQEQQAKNMERLINSIINGVVNHSPTKEENNKLTKVAEELDKYLQQILLETKASRVALVQYHNGGKGINHQSFLKMSMSNEQVQLGVKPIINSFKDQFRSSMSYFVKELNDYGYCYINDSEDIKELDVNLYELLLDRGIQAEYGLALHDADDNIMGFLLVEYTDKNNAEPTIVEKVFRDKQKVVEALLSL